MPNHRIMKFEPAAADLPERFNRLESMLFATQPARAQTAAQRYVGDLLARAVPPPPLVTQPAATLPPAE